MLTEVADGVWTHQSELLLNNTVVVRGPSGVLLVDPGITGSELECLARDLREQGTPVVAGFATHPDWDHVLWHDHLGDAARYGTARCAAFMHELRAQPGWEDRVREAFPPEIADETPVSGFGLLSALPVATPYLPWDGPQVRIVEHPAHAPGHAALLVEERGVLAAGDMLSDVLIPMLDDWNGSNDPVADYLTGLQLLEELADDVEVLVPGHGSVCRGDQVRVRIELDRAYVLALRAGETPTDPRLGASARPGWEWVSDIHEGQAQSLAARS